MYHKLLKLKYNICLILEVTFLLGVELEDIFWDADEEIDSGDDSIDDACKVPCTKMNADFFKW